SGSGSVVRRQRAGAGAVLGDRAAGASDGGRARPGAGGALRQSDCVPDSGGAGGGVSERHMIEDMAQVHISEAELARDVASVLDRVRSGTEIVIERNARPVAI